VLSARNQSRNSAVPKDDGRFMSSSSRMCRRAAGDLRQVLGLALLLVLPGGAQDMQVQTPGQQVAGRQPGGLFAGMGDTDPVMEEKRLKALNAERHKSLVSDTNKLLKLARELDEEVNHADPGALDQAQLIQVAEIEKLAHKVKEKMSTSVRGTTDSQSSPYYPPVR